MDSGLDADPPALGVTSTAFETVVSEHFAQNETVDRRARLGDGVRIGMSSLAGAATPLTAAGSESLRSESRSTQSTTVRVFTSSNWGNVTTTTNTTKATTAWQHSSNLHRNRRQRQRQLAEQPQVVADKLLTVIGICLGSTSKTMKGSAGKAGVGTIPLFTVLLPSLAKTVEPGFEFRVYVGVDEGDGFYDNDNNEKTVSDWFDKNVASPAHKQGVMVTLKILVFSNKAHKPGPAFNHACKTAYQEGADYLYRVNDDSEFMTTFAKHFVAELGNRCPPNIGVTGPTCHEGNTQILTHDFTHRQHLEIFDEYYPVELTDWWLDDWVTHVYGAKHTSRVLDVVVKHRLDAAGGSLARRRWCDAVGVVGAMGVYVPATL
jgi:hypothetical protein